MSDIDQNLKAIEDKIVLYPDFPKEGVLYRDVMPVLADPAAFNSLIQIILNKITDFEFDRVLGIESRGFLIGPVIANKLKVPFTPVRKKGKLPGHVYSVQYDLEYGRDVLEIQKSSLPQGSKCLIFDDLIATGGSIEAAKRLVELSGSQVAACAVVIELKPLGGRGRLGSTPLITVFSY